MLHELVQRNRAGSGEALPSVCSAQPEVLSACLRLAQQLGRPVLVEATSNQVNHLGGYTGMRPQDFMQSTLALCDAVGLSREAVMLGGDHLGPQAWRHLPAEEAMQHARQMVRAYVEAGFRKIHLDCSEGCLGEATPQSDAVCATRAAELAQVCEQYAPATEQLAYVIGTEVPRPGGALPAEGHVEPTSKANAQATLACHAQAFRASHLSQAWSRVVALVVQPGLEFTPERVLHFDASHPSDLPQALAEHDGICFEAHSTDYQRPPVFAQLGQRHFAVLKVGPALTYAYRRALYVLDAVAARCDASHTNRNPGALPDVMERLMLQHDAHWRAHYQGSPNELWLLRHFSYADRIRYYWAHPEAELAVQQLHEALDATPPRTYLLSSYFDAAVLDRWEALRGHLPSWSRALAQAEVQQALLPYFFTPSH